MKFIPLVLFSSLSLGCTSLSHQATPPAPLALVSVSIVDAPSQNGKKLNATYREIQRDPDRSLIETKIISGGSIDSIMFVVNGDCAVMLARGEKDYASKPIPDKPGHHWITFPKTPNEQGSQKQGLSAAECVMLRLAMSESR